MKERKKGIVPSMVWLCGYEKPVTLYEINKKIYPTKTEKSSPTSSHTYTTIDSLINKGYIVPMSHDVTLTNKDYIRSTPKPIIEHLNERLGLKNKIFTQLEEEILSNLLYSFPFRTFIGSLADEANIFIKKEINGYEISVDWITCYLFSFMDGKEKAEKHNRRILPAAGLNLSDFTRRINQYMKSKEFPNLRNDFNKNKRQMGEMLGYPLPSLNNVNLSNLEKVSFAIPDQILKKVRICMNEESMSFFFAGAGLTEKRR